MRAAPRRPAAAPISTCRRDVINPLLFMIRCPPMAAERALGVIVLVFTMTSFAQNYKAEQISDHGVPIVRLTDTAHGVEVSMLPSIGNRAYEMKVHGKNILYFPYADVSEFQKRPRLCGIPFLAPWSDLLNAPAFW